MNKIILFFFFSGAGPSAAVEPQPGEGRASAQTPSLRQPASRPSFCSQRLARPSQLPHATEQYLKQQPQQRSNQCKRVPRRLVGHQRKPANPRQRRESPRPAAALLHPSAGDGEDGGSGRRVPAPPCPPPAHPAPGLLGRRAAVPGPPAAAPGPVCPHPGAGQAAASSHDARSTVDGPSPVPDHACSTVSDPEFDPKTNYFLFIFLLIQIIININYNDLISMY
jgi:hypothetical protein